MRPFGGSMISDAWYCGSPRSSQCGGLEREVGVVLLFLARELRFARLELFLREPIAEPKLLVALHRRADHRGARPDAREVGIAPRGARDFIRARRSGIGRFLGVRHEDQRGRGQRRQPRPLEYPHAAPPSHGSPHLAAARPRGATETWLLPGNPARPRE